MAAEAGDGGPHDGEVVLERKSRIELSQEGSSATGEPAFRL